MTRRVILTILCLNILKQTSLTTLCRILPKFYEKVYPIFAKILNNFQRIQIFDRNILGWKSGRGIKIDLYLFQLGWHFFRSNPMYNSALFKFQEIFEGKIKFSKISNFDRKILFLDFNFLNSSKFMVFSFCNFHHDL